MFRWLPKKLHRRQQLFFQLAIFSFVVHIGALATYIVLARSRAVTLNMRLALIDQDTPIIVLPFVKRTQQLQRTRPHVSNAHKKVTGRRQTRVASRHAPTHAAQIAAVPPKKVAQQQAVPRASTNNPTGAKQTIKLASKKQIKQTKMPPTHIQSVTIKPEQKKLALTTQHIPAISQTREVTQAPVIEERTAVTAIANEPLVINAHAPQSFALDNELFTAESINLTTAQAPAVEENEPITIGHEEFHMMHAYQELHETITNNWHPPAGLNPRKECIIVVTVDEKGSPESITIEQPSGVRVYDIAARLAVYHSTFPTELTKQTVRLHF